MSIQKLTNQTWFRQILDSEGGFNPDEPESVGGKSYAGITQKAYDEWLEKSKYAGAPVSVEELAGSVIGTEWEKKSPLDIPTKYNVSIDIICNFYADYFKLARLEVVPKCLKYIHADFFVNSKFNANKILQRMVGFKGDDVDGILGPESRAKLMELTGSEELVREIDEDDMIMDYHHFKMQHYESIKETNPELYDKNIKGWKRRANHILAQLEDYFHDEDPTPSAIVEDDNISLFDDPEEVNEEIESTRPPVNIEAQITENVVKQISEMLPELIEEALKGRVTKSIMGRNTIAP